MAQFPFSDLHSYKDFIGFVQLSMPDRFPARGGTAVNAQWTPELAFEGLRAGLALAAQEKGNRPAFAMSQMLVDEAEKEYRAGNMRGGFLKLEEMKKLLKKIATR